MIAQCSDHWRWRCIGASLVCSVVNAVAVVAVFHPGGIVRLRRTVGDIQQVDHVNVHFDRPMPGWDR